MVGVDKFIDLEWASLSGSITDIPGTYETISSNVGKNFCLVNLKYSDTKMGAAYVQFTKDGTDYICDVFGKRIRVTNQDKVTIEDIPGGGGTSGLTEFTITDGELVGVTPQALLAKPENYCYVDTSTGNKYSVLGINRRSESSLILPLWRCSGIPAEILQFNNNFLKFNYSSIDFDNLVEGEYVEGVTTIAFTNRVSGTTLPYSTVSVSDTGTATDEIQYITVNGTEKKIAGGGSAPSNMVTTDTAQDISGVKTLTAGTHLNFIAGSSNTATIYGDNNDNFYITGSTEHTTQSGSIKIGTGSLGAIDFTVGYGGSSGHGITLISDSSYNLSLRPNQTYQQVDLGTSSYKYRTLYATNLSDGTTTTAMSQILAQSPAAPSTAGNYVLKCTIDASGNATYSWASE